MKYLVLLFVVVMAAPTVAKQLIRTPTPKRRSRNPLVRLVRSRGLGALVLLVVGAVAVAGVLFGLLTR